MIAIEAMIILRNLETSILKVFEKMLIKLVEKSQYKYANFCRKYLNINKDKISDGVISGIIKNQRNKI